MNDSFVFRPKWKPGLILHLLLAVILAAGSGFLLWLAFQQHLGGFLILFLFGALVLLAPFLLIVYRAYALYHASYTIEREGFKVHWGLRREDIPLSEIEWVRPVNELLIPLTTPRFSLPGAYLGASQHPDLGEVEFIASDYNSLVIIETANEVLAVSPEDPEDFMKMFNRSLEMGSITPIESYSSQPAEFIRSVFSQPLARGFLIAGLLLTLALTVFTSLIIPYRQVISMGVNSIGQPLDPVSSNSLLILPILGGLSLVLDVILGFNFFHKEDQRKVSYLLWAAGAVTPLLLIVALIIMVV